MFRSIQRYRFFNVERIWFSNKGDSCCDIIRFTRAEQPLKGRNVYCEPVETVLSDLRETTDEILAKSTKTVKYEVNKCRKEGVEVIFYNSKQLQDNPYILEEFENAYIYFANELHNKELLKAYNRKKVENFISCGCLLISKAFVDKVSIYHVYAYGGEECCLLYSVSNFREDPSKRNLAGRANKLLHINDMEFFKSEGIKIYDWGNISSSSNPNGIDVFKMSFGGKVSTLYNISVGNTTVGKIVLKIQSLLNKIL